MDPQPQFDPQWQTSTTVREKKDLSKHETKGGSTESSHKVLYRPPELKGGGKQGPQQPTNVSSPTVDYRMYDISLVFGIVVMLSWPWIFWGVVFRKQGAQMSGGVTKLVIDHPPYVSFFVTLVGNLVALIVDVLFSLSVVRFAQEWIATKKEVTVFQISILSAFRYQSWPWLLKDMKTVFWRRGWLPALLVGVCISAFAFVTSSTTTILTPVPFNKTIALAGTELDFSSNTGDCFQFLNANPLPKSCDWQMMGGVPYVSCLGMNQFMDVLESGRINMISLLPNNSRILTFPQFGNQPGLRFLGPSRGVLPIGPDSPVPTVDKLPTSLVSDAHMRATMLSYNYTLGLQGLSTNVTCTYDTESPIRFAAIDNTTTLALQYNGSCEGQVDFFNAHNVLSFVSVNSDSGLGYWACKSKPAPQQEQSYFVYLRGRSNYKDIVGNITCTVSPVQMGTFPVAFRPQAGVFSVEEPTSTTGTVYPELVEAPLVALAGVFGRSQNWEANVIIESIITSAFRDFGLPPYNRTSQHLRLYGAMIQGMLEYEVAYTKFIYSTIENPPPSCLRSVQGTADLQIIGWFAKMEHIGFLMPMTLINLASLILMVIVLNRADGRGYDFDPTEMRRLLMAEIPEGQHSDSDVWDSKVKYQYDHQIPPSDSR